MRTKDIEHKLCSIAEFFKNCQDGNGTFVIPEYQRGYSWTEEQCSKLFDDIVTYIHDGYDDSYFFGTIILHCETMSPDYSIIDGQQRTTTFFLLLKSLEFRISEILKTMIPNDDDGKAAKESMEEVLKTIKYIVYKISDTDELNELRKHPDLIDSISLIENKSINELFSDYFSIIMKAQTFDEAKAKCESYIEKNNKSIKITKVSFFKNLTFFMKRFAGYGESNIKNFAKKFLNKCQIIQIRSWNVDQAFAIFNTLNSRGQPLSDADIILASMYAKIHDDDVKNKIMQKWNFIRENTSEESTLFKSQILDIDSVLQQYMYVRRAEDKDNNTRTPGVRNFYTHNSAIMEKPLDLCISFEKIVQIWLDIREYALVQLLLKFNQNSKLFLISYLYKFCIIDKNGELDTSKIDEKLIEGIVTPLLKLFAILEILDTDYSNKKFKTFLFSENVKLVDKNVSIKEIINDFNNHINNKDNWDVANLIKGLSEYDKDALVYLNEYLFSVESDKPFTLGDKVNIEHIAPQSGRNIESIRQDVKAKDLDEFMSLVNKLGNKILLEEKINKSVSNEWFRTKKLSSINKKRGYKDSKFAIASALVNYKRDKWEKKDIKNATKEAASRIINFIFGTNIDCSIKI